MSAPGISAPPGLTDRRPRETTIEAMRRAETRSQRIAAAVAEIACPDCTPREYLQLLSRALELSWRKGGCDHTKFIPTADGMAAATEVGS